MLRFVIIRLGRALLTLLLSSFLIFGALYLTPGTPLAFLVGGHTLSPADLAALKAQYHLNQPFFERYLLWLGDILHGNFGQSIVFRESVSSLLAPRIGSTLLLVAYAAILIIVFGIGLGVLAATRPGRLDTSITVGTTIGLATPDVRDGDRADLAVLGDARMVSVAGLGQRLLRSHLASDAARDRAGRVWAGIHDTDLPRGAARRARAGARRDRAGARACRAA